MTKTNSTKSIATWDYLRKSTKGLRADGRQRQEKSIDQQRQELDRLGLPREILELGYTKFDIVDTFTDEGVSGWKLGNKRPGFFQMIAAIKAHPGKRKVIRVDKMDRFSRAHHDESIAVGLELQKAGVHWILSASEGVYDISKCRDLSDFFKFALACDASYKYSKDLGRRVLLAEANGALRGVRIGGGRPYGMTLAKGVLVAGAPDEVKVVKRIFTQFAVGKRSLNSIAGELNREGVPSPGKVKPPFKGTAWMTPTIAKLLRNRAYAGDLVYGKTARRVFWQLTDSGQGHVVECSRAEGIDPKPIEKKNVWKGIVERSLFDAAQARLGAVSRDRSLRKRMGYALTGILVCDNCGAPMHGATPKNGPVVYRCSTTGNCGRGICGHFAMRQDAILPFILQTLSHKIDDFCSLQAPCPIPVEPDVPRKETAQLEAEIRQLAERINVCETERFSDRNMSAARKEHLDKLAEQWHEELRLKKLLLAKPSDDEDLEDDHREHLRTWWREFLTNAVQMPVASGSEHLAKRASKKALQNGAEPWDVLRRENGQLVLKCDARLVNDALVTLGCKVRLRFKREEIAGKQRARNQFVEGHFFLGQEEVPLPSSFGTSGHRRIY